MKMAVEFPSVAFREGPAKVREMATAIEDIGYDEIAVFDHVIMGHPTETRPAPMYPPKMPILEAVVMMARAASAASSSWSSGRCWLRRGRAHGAPSVRVPPATTGTLASVPGSWCTAGT